MPLTPSSRLGLYEILAPLGAGGMGEVYRARDTRLQRDIAIKVLPDDVAASPESLARFELEATTVARLNHPNIVTLFSIEEVAGTRFLTMELVEGRSLATLIAPGGLPLVQVLDFGIAMADAMVAAHEKGVVHRDLKPANVMVTGEGRVKVLDFGLAKLAPQGADPGNARGVAADAPLTMVGEVVGTVPYMAPEQMLGNDVDARTDLFSFGILLYELATGERPFTGHTPWEVSSAILNNDPPSLTTVRSDLPADLERIIGRCLAKQPGERFQTALDLANELRGLQRGLVRGEAPARPASGAVASIAVLPFVNRSADAEDEYFSDGLADELLNVLAKIKGLRVTARTSSFHFKGKDATIADIGRTLGVATVLEGSVRKAGNRVRVGVQLVRVSDSSHLWSETYDRTLEDIFAVQDDVAQSVVKELRTTLMGEEPDSRASGVARAEVSRAMKGRGTNPEAHRLYLQARYHSLRFTRADSAKSIEYLQQALELDPQFALGWAALSTARCVAVSRAWTTAAEGMGRAREAVEKALALEPDLPEAHSAKALILLHQWEWRGAEASSRRALELAPSSAPVMRRAAVLCSFFGHFEEAVALNRRVLDQDPLDAAACHNLGMTLEAAGRHEEAEEAFRKALEIAPQRTATHGMLALALLSMGRGDQAIAEAMAEPGEIWRLYPSAIALHAVGREAEADEALRTLIARFSGDAPTLIGEVYAARREADAAFTWLEHAYAIRDTGLTELKSKPRFRPIHGDPRWKALLGKLGLED